MVLLSDSLRATVEKDLFQTKTRFISELVQIHSDACQIYSGLPKAFEEHICWQLAQLYKGNHCTLRYVRTIMPM